MSLAVLKAKNQSSLQVLIFQDQIDSAIVMRLPLFQPSSSCQFLKLSLQVLELISRACSLLCESASYAKHRNDY